MNIIAIQPKPLSIFGTADGVALHVDFYIGMETFTIDAQFYDGLQKINGPIPLPVSLSTIEGWAITAGANPSKAGFLNFQIVKEWALAQLDVEVV